MAFLVILSDNKVIVLSVSNISQIQELIFEVINHYH